MGLYDIINEISQKNSNYDNFEIIAGILDLDVKKLSIKNFTFSYSTLMFSDTMVSKINLAIIDEESSISCICVKIHNEILVLDRIGVI